MFTLLMAREAELHRGSRHAGGGSRAQIPARLPPQRPQTLAARSMAEERRLVLQEAEADRRRELRLAEYRRALLQQMAERDARRQRQMDLEAFQAERRRALEQGGAAGDIEMGLQLQPQPQPQPLPGVLNLREPTYRALLGFAGWLLGFAGCAYVYLFGEYCSIGIFIWGGRQWYRHLVILAVPILDAVILVWLIARRPRLIVPRWKRMLVQLLFVVFSLIAGQKFTDLASIPLTILLSFHTVPVCQLLSVPDDFNFYDCFTGMAMSGILSHFGKGVLGWSMVTLYGGVMLAVKLTVTLLFEWFAGEPGREHAA